MPRLFVGVPAPREMTLDKVRRSLQAFGDDVKIVDPSQYHVTIAFLGDTPEQSIEDVLEGIEAGLEGESARRGVVYGLGAFPAERNARVLWAGIWNTGLKPTAQAIRDALAERDISFDDKHPFSPHLTIARLRGRQNVSALVDEHATHAFGPFPVERVVLWASELTPDGPIYTERGSVELEAAE